MSAEEPFIRRHARHPVLGTKYRERAEGISDEVSANGHARLANFHKALARTFAHLVQIPSS